MNGAVAGFLLGVLALLPFAAAHEAFSFESASLIGLEEEVAEHFPAAAAGWLAPLWRFAEEVQLFFAFDRLKKAELSDSFARRRFGEALTALRGGRDGAVELEAFGREANRTVENIVLAAQSGREAGRVVEALEKTLLGAAIQLEIAGIRSGADFSADRDHALAGVGRAQAAANRTGSADALAGLQNRLAGIISGAAVRQMEIVRSELEAHMKELGSVLAEAEDGMFARKKEIALKRSDVLKKAVEEAGLFNKTLENSSVRQGFRVLAALRAEIDGLTGAVQKKKGAPEVCIQVIAPARNPQTGECAEYPTPCDVPAGWEKVSSCG